MNVEGAFTGFLNFDFENFRIRRATARVAAAVRANTPSAQSLAVITASVVMLVVCSKYLCRSASPVTPSYDSSQQQSVIIRNSIWVLIGRDI